MKTKIITSSILFFLSTAIWTQAGTLTISDTKVEPGIINPGNQILLSCRMIHSTGSENIARVAALLANGNMVTSYPNLYDDGTSGDRTPGDGIYSLLITAPTKPGEAKITFLAVDKERNEVESEPVVLTIN